MLVPRIPHKINDLVNTEFEEPQKYHQFYADFEEPQNIIRFMRNSRNQQFFRIYQGFYGSSKILWFLEFRTKKEKVQLLTITHFSFFLSCHFFSFVAVASASSCRTASPARRRAGKAVKNASFQVRVVGLGNDMLLQVM